MKALSQLRLYQSPKPRITAALLATSRMKLWRLRRTRERRGHQRWPSKRSPKNHRVSSQLLQPPRQKLLLKLMGQCLILPKRNHPRRSLPSSRTLLLWTIGALRGQIRRRPDHLLSAPSDIKEAAAFCISLTCKVSLHQERWTEEPLSQKDQLSPTSFPI